MMMMATIIIIVVVDYTQVAPALPRVLCQNICLSLTFFSPLAPVFCPCFLLSYVLMIGLREGSYFIVRFASRKLYEAIRALFIYAYVAVVCGGREVLFGCLFVYLFIVLFFCYFPHAFAFSTDV